MNAPSYGDTDPIAAIATALGESALALIRTSGEGSLELLEKIFSRPEKLREAGGNTMVHGWILGSKGERIDDVLVSVYRGPAAFTGEDGADISCHGGVAAARAVMEALAHAGFREALRGEFSFRAFMNGKLDLTRAESIMEIVAAKTGAAREHAVRRLSGALEREIREINAALVQTLAAAEIYLDYSEDDGVGGDDGDEAAGLLPDRRLAEEALARLRTLSASYRRERLYAQGALAVIAGRPNAGKSSLFNALLREDRAIVTDIPGTTRDWIEAWLSIDGIPVRLTDTAGLHASQDPVEQLGMERSRELMAAADLVLYVLDGAEGLTREDHEFLTNHGADATPELDPQGPAPQAPTGTEPASQAPTGTALNQQASTQPTLIVWNKADLAPPPPFFRPVSAKTGEGITELAGEIAAVLEHSLGGGDSSAGAGTERQKALIDRAIAALEEALALADRREPLDLIAPALREAVNALGEITGEVSTADLLDAMFSRFCVGK
ncbi:MAG: tRNA uridine-5-carboxymethylaminomethyl(34) synthesis GTPase MnmE [Treponema sp.]|jgi:tRNA modification GTPase|nr:tRNA uridine-5-carboxymethylaminomethyl(34) synthesis GTPase MnmE [Treponema sp.]